MNYVYLPCKHYHYNDTNILGVYKSIDGARACILKDINWYLEMNYEISEKENNIWEGINTTWYISEEIVKD